ncbi:MAG TPA: TetR/AcrR family transcriptional regulator [Blastococcus sp.]|nr:TetR/AcrR family transcriptional regulator [Nocardioides sp.]HYH27119.1 TetR/AcrR family transcriptional regulator [Blastococcus sp.]
MPRPPGHGPGYEARRQEIIDAAATLFADKGYTATGVIELCQAVGLGKGALYHYIGSKENLLVEIQDRVLVPLLAKARSITALSDEEPLVRLRLLSQALLEIIFARVDHIWVYEHDYRHVTGQNRKRLVRQRLEFEDLVRDLLREAIDDGALRPVDLRLAVLQFLNLHNHTYQWAHTAAAGWTPARLAAEYCSTVFTGLASRPFSMADFEEKVRLAQQRADGLAS